ncbi:MAG: hypothetical protein N4A50_01570 [Vallitalea sp.]|jgi:hypothetical protein|nr:hypothetical protein [Vallitalea sp.]
MSKKSKKVKLFYSILIIIIITSSITIAISNRKTNFDKFVEQYERSIAKIMKSIDIDNIKETLLTKENDKIMSHLKEELEEIQDYVPEKRKSEYLYMRMKYSNLEKTMNIVKDWDNIETFQQMQMITDLISQQVMYE